MAKRAIRSFTVAAGDRVYSIHPNMVFADSHPLTTAHAAKFESIPELTADALDTPANVTAGDPGTTTVTVDWDEVEHAESYRVTTTPATTTRNVTTNTVDLTGLTAETGYTVNVVAVTTNPFRANSSAGTDTFTTDAA